MTYGLPSQFSVINPRGYSITLRPRPTKKRPLPAPGSMTKADAKRPIKQTNLSCSQFTKNPSS